MDNTTELETTPILPTAKPKSLSPIIPMLLGVVVVIILSSLFAGAYYFAKLKKEVTTSTTPTPSPSIESSPAPTTDPSPSPTSSTKNSPKPSSKTNSPKPSLTTTASTTPSPTPTTSLDIRFGNPSAHIKQTIDEGKGDGRVINREFSSLQTGEFDEVKTSFSPRNTVCIHIVSNQNLEGSKIGFTMTLDNKIITEGTLSQYQKIEAGKTYDVCSDVTTDLGSHSITLNINNTKSILESNYTNNLARIDYKNLADNIAPNFTLIGPTNNNSEGTCLSPQYIEDNVTTTAKLKIEQRVDSGDWVTFSTSKYCFKGNGGEEHTYAIRITDERGNKSEQSNKFNIF